MSGEGTALISRADPDFETLSSTGAAIASWRRRTETYSIIARLALGALILTVYTFAPRPTDMGEDGRLTLFIIALYIAFALLRAALHATKRFDGIAAIASAPIDFALLGFLIHSYQRAYDGGPALSLQAPSFAFYFVFIALHGMRLEWRQALAAGICAIASWACVVAAALASDGGENITHKYADFAQTGAILVGAEVERLIALCMMTAATAFAAHRSQALRVLLLKTGRKAERDKNRARTQMLVRAKEAAERANELKSQFLAKMGHELKTPLNSVIGYADLLNASQLDPDQRRYAATVKTSGETLLLLINSILDATSLEASNAVLAREPFSPGRLIREIGTDCALRAKAKGVACKTSIGPRIPEIAIGDELRLRKALDAIVDNALKFTQVGEIEISAYAEHRLDSRTTLVVSVADTGVGIEEADHQRIFELFEQADNSPTRPFDGAGLGLAVSRRYIELMGGRVILRSAAGAGSVFRIELPLDGPPPNSIPVQGQPNGARPHRRIKMIVGDNDAAAWSNKVDALRAEGIDATFVADGLDLIERFEEGGCEIIFIPLELPGLGCAGAAKIIRAIERDRGLPRTPIIGTTSMSAASPDGKMAVELDEIICAPGDIGAIRDVIRKHCAANAAMRQSAL